ncbi:MAG: 16S rRNA (cytidine(1402)-2'-O)-methyltransferase [Acetobacteraceae bacterium]|nr:16S rRNA (cytidine(1402)-2'-O)-methyltransferase [Acetobacteraceae bacterium]
MPGEASHPPSKNSESGFPEPPCGLVLVSTPIGNLRDLTPRARDALQAADLVLCEDTRRTRKLLAALGIEARLRSLHDHNEDQRIPEVLDLLRQGKRVALVSDAGTPLISDPGYRLVRAAIAEELPVGAAPGVNAAVAALALSGLPPLPFLVLGFPPPRPGPRRAGFERIRAAERAGLSATLIWYEAPHRLAETLEDMALVFGDRPAAVARELTKQFEEVRRGTLPALAAHYAASPARGEVTLLAGPASDDAPGLQDLDEALRQALAAHSLRDAAALVSAALRLPKKLVYERALGLQTPIRRQQE